MQNENITVQRTVGVRPAGSCLRQPWS